MLTTAQMHAMLDTNVLTFASLCIYKVAISASKDGLEASIDAFSGAKEGDVASSPSPLVNN